MRTFTIDAHAEFDVDRSVWVGAIAIAGRVLMEMKLEKAKTRDEAYEILLDTFAAKWRAR